MSNRIRAQVVCYYATLLALVAISKPAWGIKEAIYRNDYVGYEISYPAAWKLYAEDPLKLLLEPPYQTEVGPDFGVWIKEVRLATQSELRKWIEKKFGHSVTLTETSIGGRPGYSFEVAERMGGFSRHHCVLRDELTVLDIVWTVFQDSISPADMENYQSQINALLKNFRFVAPKEP